MARNTLTELEAVLVHETAGAYLFDFGLDDNMWIPKASCEWCPEDGIVTVRESYAIEKGLV